MDTNFFKTAEVLSWAGYVLAAMLELEQEVKEAGNTKTSVRLDLYVVATNERAFPPGDRQHGAARSFPLRSAASSSQLGHL